MLYRPRSCLWLLCPGLSWELEEICWEIREGHKKKSIIRVVAASNNRILIQRALPNL